MPAIGLGISTVTLWTPYPGPGGAPEDEGLAPGPARAGLAGPALVSQLPDELLSSALTDEQLAGQLIDDMIDRMLADPPPPARESRWRLRALIPRRSRSGRPGHLPARPADRGQPASLMIGRSRPRTGPSRARARAPRRPEP